MKPKLTRWTNTALAVLRRYLALDMTVYAGSATLFLLTASFPLLMWVLLLVNLIPVFSVEGVAELLADFLPPIPEIQTAAVQLLQSLSGQSAQFVASLAVLTTIVSASGGVSALQVGLQRWLEHVTATLQVALIGYALAIALAIPLAIAITRSQLLSKIIMPWLVVIQSTPIVAVAPIIVVTLGAGLLPRVVITSDGPSAGPWLSANWVMLATGREPWPASAEPNQSTSRSSILATTLAGMASNFSSAAKRAS